MHLFYIIITYITEVIFYFLPLSSYLSVTRITQKVVDEYSMIFWRSGCVTGNWLDFGDEKAKSSPPCLSSSLERVRYACYATACMCREGAFSTVM